MGKKKGAKGPPPNKPNTPTITSSNPDVRSPVTIALKRKRSVSEDRQSSIAPFHTPPTSPATPAVEEPHSMSGMMQEDHGSTLSVPYLTADDIASSNQDIVAIADLFSTMKKTLASMKGSLDRLGGQSEKMVSCALDIHAAGQVCRSMSFQAVFLSWFNPFSFFFVLESHSLINFVGPSISKSRSRHMISKPSVSPWNPR